MNCIAQCPDPDTFIDHVIMYLSYPAENAKLRPFFRKDKGALLSSPVLCSVVSAPAVNAGVVGAKSERVMQVMQAAAVWGCGTYWDMHGYARVNIGKYGQKVQDSRVMKA